MSPRPALRVPGGRRTVIALAALVLIAAAVIVGGYIYARGRTGNVYHPHALFIPQPTPVLPKQAPDHFSWPLYGYSPDHTRFFPAPARVRPPFRQAWVHNSHTLLEFPPVIYGALIYQLGDDAVLAAINRHTGKLIWARRLGRLSASSPAVDAKTVYVTILSALKGAGGSVYALNSATGQTRWSRELPSRSESSPLLDRGRLYFGSESGRVYCLDARNGRPIWAYQAGGSVKASPTLSGGVLYFGDYSGTVQAISEQTGRRIWASQSEGALLGSGTFYSTAAVIYGRVFLGNTDGHVYAYDAASGRLDWAIQTGDYVYASPAVTNAPGVGPTVYVGSYSGEFMAINAQSGHVRWSFNAHGKISGSATIIGRVVYFADLGEHRTYGLDISTGRREYMSYTGSFDAAISDGNNVLMTGSTSLFAYTPR